MNRYKGLREGTSLAQGTAKTNGPKEDGAQGGTLPVKEGQAERGRNEAER